MSEISYIYQLKDIKFVAKKLLEQLDANVVLVNGDMGAGKTTLITALVEALGSDDVVSSPTFSIVNEYVIPDYVVYHFDFYRLESTEEALNFGVEEYLYTNNWIFIECSERVKDLIPENHCIIDITTINTDERSLKLTLNKKACNTEQKIRQFE